MMCYKLCLMLSLLLFYVQDGGGQNPQHEEKQRFRLEELSRASTSFGVSLFQHLLSRDQNNVIFSPFSVFTALSMTLAGTRGRAKDQLKTVLALRPRQGIHRALHAVFASFPRSLEANVTLRVANRLYYNDTVTVTSPFSRHLGLHYEAEPKAFQRPNPEVEINDWVSSQTGNMIQDFLSPGDINNDTVLLLLNAVYFQGTWKDIFREESTHQGDFTTASGQVVRVPLMFRDGQYSVKAAGAGFAAQVLELPYGTDGRFSMFIILPDEVDGLRDLEESLNGQNLEEAVSNMPEPYRHWIHVPKFSLRVKTSMKNILQTMGLTEIFRIGCDFSRMIQQPPDNLAVEDVKHEAVIEVNERGTKAAAVTSIEVMLMSLPPQFSVNRPFLFVLRDNTARLNLFLGRVTDPSN